MKQEVHCCFLALGWLILLWIVNDTAVKELSCYAVRYFEGIVMHDTKNVPYMFSVIESMQTGIDKWK